AVSILVLVVAYTPMIVPLAHSLERSDPLSHADAVLVLSSDIQPDGDLTAQAQSRLIHGYELLRAGYAPRLLLTRIPPPAPSYVPTVSAQLHALGLQYPIDEVGPVANTHDE